MESLDADVLIVGAGPAGAAAACHFARAGFHVVLIDQSRFPRDKVCGDFVGPWSMDEIDRLGLSSQPPFQEGHRIRRAALHLDGKRMVEAPLPHLPGLRDHGLCIPRLQLDKAIVDAAVASGARLIEEAHVTGFEVDNEAASLVYRTGKGIHRLRGRFVLGADGSTSLIARILRGTASPKRDRIIAVRAYFDEALGGSDQATLYVNADIFPGYYWIFPNSTNSVNVGVGAVLETWPKSTQQLRDFLSGMIHSDRAIRARLGEAKMRDRIDGWPLATFNPRLPVVGDRVALIGDAAGFINPLNGEGIQYALQSARWSAETLREALANDKVSASNLRPYVLGVQAEMRFDMAVTRLLVDLTRNRRLNNLWLSVLESVAKRAARDSGYADVFAGVFSGVARARKLFSLPFLRDTIEEAINEQGAWPLDAVRTGVVIIRKSVAHPLETVDWTVQCGLAVVELAAAVSRANRV